MTVVYVLASTDRTVDPRDEGRMQLSRRQARRMLQRHVPTGRRWGGERGCRTWALDIPGFYLHAYCAPLEALQLVGGR